MVIDDNYELSTLVVSLDVVLDLRPNLNDLHGLVVRYLRGCPMISGTTTRGVFAHVALFHSFARRVCLGWAFAEAIISYLAPLWMGARGVEFSWANIQMGMRSNVGVVSSLMHFCSCFDSNIYIHSNSLSFSLSRARARDVAFSQVLCSKRLPCCVFALTHCAAT